jgi:hypothetical protein
VFYPMLYGAEPEMDIDTVVKGAVDAFLRLRVRQKTGNGPPPGSWLRH